jgi:hypothetical protein
MKWYERRRKLGLCVGCGMPSEQYRCDTCRGILNYRVSVMRAKRRAEGLCTMCGCGECMCNRKPKQSTRKPKDDIAEQIVLAVGDIDARTDAGYRKMMEAVIEVLERYGLPREKREKMVRR